MSMEADTVMLQSSDDWEIWERQFIARAFSADLWEIISSEREFAAKPTPPKARDYDKKLDTRNSGVGIRSQSAQSSHVNQVNMQVEEVDPINRPRTVVEMTTASRQAFQLDWAVFQHLFKQYTIERKAIHKLKNWVANTTSDHLFRTACDPKGDLKSWYTNLKTRAGVSDVDRRKLAKVSYKQAMKPLASPPQDVVGWVNDWEEAMTKAADNNIPDAVDPYHWFQDLSFAIDKFSREWATAFKDYNYTKINEGTLTFREVAHELRWELEEQHHTQSFIASLTNGREACVSLHTGTDAVLEKTAEVTTDTLHHGADRGVEKTAEVTRETLHAGADRSVEEPMEVTREPLRAGADRGVEKPLEVTRETLHAGADRGVEEPMEATSESLADVPRWHGGYQGQKRKRTVGEGSVMCAACRLFGHDLEHCLFVFPERANGTFRARGGARGGRQEQVNRRLEVDGQLRADIERIRGKRPRDEVEVKLEGMSYPY